MFNNYKESINQNTKSVNEVYVGIGVAKVLAINPTQDELSSIIGPETAERFDTKYNTTTNYNGDQSRPITVWLTDEDEKVRPTILNLNLADVPRVSKNEKTQYLGYRVDPEGNPTTLSFAWPEKNNPEQFDWFKPLTEAKDGMEQYYTFLYTILRWNDPTNFVEALVENELDFDTIYNGNFDGLRRLVDYLNDNDINSITMLFDARMIERDGGAMMVQSVVNRPNTWRKEYNGINDWVLNYYEGVRKKQVDAGYDISKNFYIIDHLQPYTDELRTKEIPVDTATEDTTSLLDDILS